MFALVGGPDQGRSTSKRRSPEPPHHSTLRGKLLPERTPPRSSPQDSISGRVSIPFRADTPFLAGARSLLPALGRHEEVGHVDLDVGGGVRALQPQDVGEERGAVPAALLQLARVHHHALQLGAPAAGRGGEYENRVKGVLG